MSYIKVVNLVKKAFYDLNIFLILLIIHEIKFVGLMKLLKSKKLSLKNENSIVDV